MGSWNMEPLIVLKLLLIFNLSSGPDLWNILNKYEGKALKIRNQVRLQKKCTSLMLPHKKKYIYILSDKDFE